MRPLEELLKDMELWQISRLIFVDWSKKGKGVSPYAKPYLDAMGTLASVHRNYGADSGESIVLYFLANAKGWRGETARKVKAHLKKLVNA